MPPFGYAHALLTRSIVFFWGFAFRDLFGPSSKLGVLGRLGLVSILVYYYIIVNPFLKSGQSQVG